MTLNLSIPQDIEQKINTQVQNGMYDNANDLINEALREFFDRSNEGEVLSLFVKNRLKEIEERGEKFEEADLSQLKNIRQEVNQKINMQKNG